MSQKKCVKCGTPLENVAVFCGECGTKVETVAPKSVNEIVKRPEKSTVTKTQSDFSANTSSGSSSGPSTAAMVAAIVGGIFLMGVFGAAVWYFIFYVPSVSPSKSIADSKEEKTKVVKAIDGPPIDSLSPEETEVALQEGLKLPELVGFNAEQNIVMPFSVTPLIVSIEGPSKMAFHLFFDSTCGVVVQDPQVVNKAVFIAPSEPGKCTVRAEVVSANMLASASESISLLVEGELEEELTYE